MDMINIQYVFKLDKQKPEIIDLQLDPQTIDLLSTPCDNLPFWTQLDFHHCPHCPLDFFAHTMPFLIEEQLDEIRHLFTSYFTRPPET